MSHGADEVERSVTPPMATARAEGGRAGRGDAAWWVAAILAIVAVVGLIFMFTRQSDPADLQAARDEGVAQATLTNATTNAQAAAVDASRAAQTAVEGAARASEAAATSAANAAERTAQAAEDSAAATSGVGQDAILPPQ